MDHYSSYYYFPLKRQRPRRLLPVRSSRGIKIRLRKRLAQYFYRAKIRVSRVLARFCAKLRTGLSRVNPGLGRAYARVGEEKVVDCAQRAPKGHLAVYVGPTGVAVAAERMVVPLIYINHPLFKKLLDEVEEKYGFDHHPGGLTIPCTVSEFETVKTRIATGRAQKKASPPRLTRPY